MGWIFRATTSGNKRMPEIPGTTHPAMRVLYLPSESGRVSSLEKFRLIHFGCGGSCGFNTGPARDQLVIGASVFSLTEAFAKGVEPISKLAYRLRFAIERSK